MEEEEEEDDDDDSMDESTEGEADMSCVICGSAHWTRMLRDTMSYV